MRSPLFALPLLAACASAPRPVPTTVAPAAPVLSIDAASVVSQSLRGHALRVSATVTDPSPVSIRLLEGEGSPEERTLASETAIPADGKVSTTLPVAFGNDAGSLRPYQERTTVPLLVELRQGERRETRAVVVRAPRWPVAKVVNVQASSPEPGLLEMTLRLVLANPDPWDVRVGTLRAAATIGGKPLDPVEFTIAAKVPASSEGEYELPVALTAAQAGGAKALTALLKKGELAWTVVGTLDADGIALPVELSGAVKVSAR